MQSDTMRVYGLDIYESTIGKAAQLTPTSERELSYTAFYGLSCGLIFLLVGDVTTDAPVSLKPGDFLICTRRERIL
jgi:hypothetical protein